MDLDNQLKENIKEEMSLLPKETQGVINNFEFGNIFSEISKNYKLSEEEAKKLQTETILVLIGLVDHKIYSQNIENNVGVSEKEAVNIEREVNKKIFEPIYNKVVSMIKQNMEKINQTWEKRVNFIISGGDYSVFLDK